MNILDIILLLLILISGIITGIRKGFVYQTVTLIAIVLGAYLAYNFSSQAAARLLPMMDIPANVLNIIAFILVFLVVYLAIYLLGMIIRKMFKIVFGGWVDKLLGAILATAKVVLILGILIMAFDAINGAFGFISQKRMDQSLVYVEIKHITSVIFPYLKGLITKGA